jgi:hypothetical protein
MTTAHPGFVSAQKGSFGALDLSKEGRPEDLRGSEKRIALAGTVASAVMPSATASRKRLTPDAAAIARAKLAHRPVGLDGYPID